MDRPATVLENHLSGYYVHKKTRSRFAIIQECKIIVGGDWTDGVCYLRKGEMFVRTKEDFDFKFEKE